MLDPIFRHFGSQNATLWAPFFASKIAKTDWKMERPKSHPKPPQLGFKTAQVRLKKLHEAPKIHFCSALAPKMPPSGCLFVPKLLPTSVKNRSAPKAPHNHLKFHPRRLKMPQRDSNKLPRESQRVQKASQEASKKSKESLRTPLGPKRGPIKLQ